MAATQKAIAIRDRLFSELTVRDGTRTLTKGFGSTNMPTLLWGAGTTSNAGAFFRVQPYTWASALTTLGAAAQVFQPHVIQVCYEEHVNVTTHAEILALVFGVAISTGCMIEWYTVASGNSYNEAGITGTPEATWTPDLKWNITKAQ